ncbi:MAG: xanthine dehydrogenase family protein subunit M [Granulosicoccus sp.]
MIPGQFEYHRPDSLQAAIGLLGEYGDDSRIIAGGHSLIPMMKLRLATPEHLIDLAQVGDLKFIRTDNQTVSIGAMTTQHELINDTELARVAPIVRETALQIADPQIRYVGTVGGNVANGDPGNDMPALMQCLDASFTLVGPDGERQVAAREFYEAAYFTARDDLEILTAISFPVRQGGYSYEKQKRKIGDYATAAAAVLLQMDGDTCTYASIALTNLADTPVYCDKAVDLLHGSTLDEAVIAAAAALCVDATEPVEDNRGPVEFKRHAAGVVTRRAIETARSRC